MIIDDPVPLSEAVKFMLAKDILPTNLDSAGLRELDAAIRRQSMFSAKTTNEYLLQLYRDRIAGILHPEPAEGQATTDFSPAYVRQAVKDLLVETGYQPEADQRGTVKDLSSDARINLVIQTNRDMARSAGTFIEGQAAAILDEWPAQELFRAEDRKEPRDWPQRWRLCAAVVGDVDAARVLDTTGQMIARKDSEIWQALGDGDDGSTDTLGNPFPPFAFMSGMWVRDVDRAMAQTLGLIDANETVKPFSLADLFKGAA